MCRHSVDVNVVVTSVHCRSHGGTLTPSTKNHSSISSFSISNHSTLDIQHYILFSTCLIKSQHQSFHAREEIMWCHIRTVELCAQRQFFRQRRGCMTGIPKTIRPRRYVMRSVMPQSASSLERCISFISGWGPWLSRQKQWQLECTTDLLTQTRSSIHQIHIGCVLLGPTTFQKGPQLSNDATRGHRSLLCQIQSL